MKVIMNIPKVNIADKKQTDDFKLDTDSDVLLKFDQLLKSMKSEKKNVIKLPTDNTNDDTSDVENLGKLFNIDIKNNPDEFINDDGTINIFDIINNYGNNLSSNDLSKFGDTINSLHKNNKISDEDYFYALNWINKKYLEKSITLSIKDKIDDENLKIGDHSKDGNTLHKIFSDDKDKPSKLTSFSTLKKHRKKGTLY